MVPKMYQRLRAYESWSALSDVTALVQTCHSGLNTPLVEGGLRSSFFAHKPEVLTLLSAMATCETFCKTHLYLLLHVRAYISLKN